MKKENTEGDSWKMTEIGTAEVLDLLENLYENGQKSKEQNQKPMDNMFNKTRRQCTKVQKQTTSSLKPAREGKVCRSQGRTRGI